MTTTASSSESSMFNVVRFTDALHRLNPSSSSSFSSAVHAFASIDSTMTQAKRLLEQSSSPFSLHTSIIIADEQTAGIGRRGRLWHSARAAGLYFTFFWAPQPTAQPPSASANNSDPAAFFKSAIKLNFATPLAVVLALHKIGVSNARLKWPNDVWCGSRKICGMLVDNVDSCSIVGVGVNLNQRFDRFAENPDIDAETAELARIATSIAQELDVPSFDDRESFLADIVSRIDHSMQHESLDQVLAQVSKVHLLQDQIIRVHHKTRELSDDRDYDAKVLGLSAFGYLRVQRLSDSEILELSGEEVTVRPQPAN